MPTEHERDEMAERLRPVGLQCHVKVKEDGISFSQGSRNIHRPKVCKLSAATADRCLPGAIYNHMSAIHETLPLPRLLPIVYQDRLIVFPQVTRLQTRSQVNMDRLTQLQDTLDDVCDLCDKPTTLERRTDNT